MPKEGFSSITISEELDDKISEFLEENRSFVGNKSQAISHAWQLYENLFSKYKNPAPVKIGEKFVGPNQPLFFIGEIGINHNGDLNMAKKLIDIAIEKGCDAVKFQKRIPELCVPESHKKKIRETPWGEMTYLDYKKKIEFNEEEFREIERYCKEKNIMWFVSVWDVPSLEIMEQFDTPVYKIPSAALTHKELLIKLKETGKPLILSTGMSSMGELEKAIKILGEENLIILHCTSTYPAKNDEIDLNVLKTFRKMFNCPIGYSGHEKGFSASIGASALGACVIEKHITLDKTLWGTDQAASLDPAELEEACKGCKQMTTMLGNYDKKMYLSEVSVKDRQAA